MIQKGCIVCGEPCGSNELCQRHIFGAIETLKPPGFVAQVGGDHYNQGSRPQHWDLAIMYKWDPFQYQITKYVMRWKSKHQTPEEKLTDLKKARSFLDKYIQNYEAYLK